MDDSNMRQRIWCVLEAIDFAERERWARRIVCSSLGATFLALGLNGCLPPGPPASRAEPAPIAQPDLGGCPNCEYAAPFIREPIPIQDPLPRPKYAADIDTPRPAYALAEPRPVPTPPQPVVHPRPHPVPAYGVYPPVTHAEYAAPFPDEINQSPTLKYGVHPPSGSPAPKTTPYVKYAVPPEQPAATSAPAVTRPTHGAVARYGVMPPGER